MLVRLFVSTVLALSISCSETEQTGSETAFVSRMNIEDAKLLIIGTQDESNHQRLYKSLASGEINEVSFFDRDGNKITLADHPFAIHDINETYMAMEFSTPPESSEHRSTALLVRKQDGATFLITPTDENTEVKHSIIGFSNDPDFQTDADDNVYFITGERGETASKQIARINVTDPNALTQEILTPPSEEVQRFAVGHDGLIVYEASTSARTVTRSLTPNGVLRERRDTRVFWRGIEDVFISESGAVARLTLGGGDEIVETPYWDPDTTVSIEDALQIVVSDRFYIVQGNRVIEIENPDNTPIEINVPLDPFDVSASDAHIYFAGVDDQGTNIVRVGLLDHQVESILPEGFYEVRNIDAAPNGIVTFEGLRLSDQADVILEIDLDNNPNTLAQEQFNGKLRALFRIR